MTRILIWALYLISASVLLSCSSDSDNISDTTQVITQESAQLTSSETPEAVVHQFLSWYQKNHELLATIPLIPASLDDDTTNSYAVDFGAADQYFTSLRSSGLISESYINSEKHYMQKADSLLHNEPQTDGPPVGFNYDRVVFSQDADADLPLLIQSNPTVTITGNKARVFFPQLPTGSRQGPELKFQLTKHNDRWLIDSIKPIFPQ